MIKSDRFKVVLTIAAVNADLPFHYGTEQRRMLVVKYYHPNLTYFEAYADGKLETYKHLHKSMLLCK